MVVSGVIAVGDIDVGLFLSKSVPNAGLRICDSEWRATLPSGYICFCVRNDLKQNEAQSACSESPDKGKR